MAHDPGRSGHNHPHGPGSSGHDHSAHGGAQEHEWADGAELVGDEDLADDEWDEDFDEADELGLKEAFGLPDRAPADPAALGRGARRHGACRPHAGRAGRARLLGGRGGPCGGRGRPVV